ncbi:MAG: hypothetical protein JO088_00950 [Acidobacteria bacterium]|nr:hypothetical protein [Acidobacteriota bacterium]
MKTLAITAALTLFAVSLFGAADLVTTLNPPNPHLRAGFATTVFFQVRNNGPDVAQAVTTSISLPVPYTCICDFGDIPAGQSRGGSISFTAPATDGPMTLTATASSQTPDPNADNSSASIVFDVSADPDVSIGLTAPFINDLSLPFAVSVFLGNASNTTAHDVEVTIDFPSDVAVKSLPAGCSSPFLGRVVCRLDSLPPTVNAPGPRLSLQFVAPPTAGIGSITFKGVVTEREHDFDPINNANTVQMLLYKTFYVDNTKNDGSGSLRAAILDANAQCRGDERCAIAFRIEQASPKPWKSIAITSPLPAVTAPLVRIDGGTQSAFFGDTNPDGPDVEIAGAGTPDGDGLVVNNCGAEVANLAVNGFGRNGISVAQTQEPRCATPGAFLHHLFVGTDPTGSIARPNARGIGMSFANGTNINTAGAAASINDSVISGNLHSGIFGLSGRLTIARNRIGVKAHADDPLPNGNAGVFIGAGGYGSDVGASLFNGSAAPDSDGNVIAYNGEMGVAVAAGVADVAIRNNHIWGNKLLGIDIGLDGPTQSSGGVSMPAITLAHYDPVAKQTVIEGDISGNSGSTFNSEVGLFANDAPDPTGLGEGQRPLGVVRIASNLNHFRLAVDGDLTGQFISATMTRIRYVGFAKPEGIDQLFLTQTSEFSPAIEVR